MKVVTSEQMQLLDAEAIHSHGVPGLELMERAGRQSAALIMTEYSELASPKALVLAGKGNNGGDGYVVARLLGEKGWLVKVVVLVGREEIQGDAAVNLNRLPEQIELAFCRDEAAVTHCLQDLAPYSVIVDALFGTGLTHPVAGRYRLAIDTVNTADRPVVAIDIPSGIHGTTGKVLGTALHADLTVTFAIAKLGHVLYPGAAHAGRIKVVDIGIPSEIIASAPGYEFVDRDVAANIIKPRGRSTHKGNFGHCLIIAGSTGHTGAASLAASGAVRSGAGLVSLAIPASLNSILETKTTEAMTLPCCDNGQGYFAEVAASELLDALSGKNIVMFGPGISRQGETISLVKRLVREISLPMVIDADGLNALAEEPSVLLKTRSPSIVITPHPGEMARLVNLSVAEVEADRIGIAREFASQYQVVVVLKGARTVIATPSGEVSINGSGNPGMASGGMGDVLAGLLTSLIGQGYPPYEACQLGVFVHGLAADIVAREKGEIGITASDIAESLPIAFKELFDHKMHWPEEVT